MIKKITLILLISSCLWAQKGADEALPIELLYFYGEAVGDSAMLYWGTATEFNNYGFEIQRSLDDFSYTPIGFVEGHGNSFAPKDYSYTDADLPENGIYYYRLKQIDTDGSFVYSDTATVEIVTSLEEVSISPKGYRLSGYPNPFNPSTNISFTLYKEGEYRLLLYSSIGEELEILSEGYKPAGSYDLRFEGNGLSSGIYYIRLITDKITLTQKVILLK